MEPQFDALAEDTGLEVVDPIESRRFVLYTSSRVAPRPADTDGFVFPISTACSVTTSAVTVPETVGSRLRYAADADHIAEITHTTDRSFPADSYLLELSAPIKLYLRMDAALDVSATDEHIRIEFPEPTRVAVGARSLHTSPAETVTVPDDPAALMEAVSAFGSALKTTTCERSWPTLRGHPPRVERGDHLSIPDALDSPDTGVTLRVPADYEHVYAVAPLAYYLGADLVPGESPGLTTADGFVHRLDPDRFDESVVRTLEQVFFLDCLTRTEGYYRVDLRERRDFEARIDADIDFAALYDADPGERLETYLSLPYETLAPLVPTWQRVTYVRPRPGSAELLPYVVNDLSLVKVRPGGPVETPDTDEQRAMDELASFKRGRGPTGVAESATVLRSAGERDDHVRSGGGRAGSGEGPADRSGRDSATGIPGPGEYVPLPDTDDAIERAWVGEGTPEHGAKLLPAAFERDTPAPTDGTIDVTVVCNDERMREEHESVSEMYTGKEVVPVDVDQRFGVGTDDLETLLARDADLFHFIGHIDGRGFECPDGVLDATDVDHAGATAFLLNACRSHDQGVALVEAGAEAAVVSLGDVGNKGAVEVGETLAGLLNHGFTVGSALEVAMEYTTIGRHYVAIGDPSVAVTQCSTGCPFIYDVSQAAGGAVDVTIRTYLPSERGMGMMTNLYLEDDETCYLSSGELTRLRLDESRLYETINDSAPVAIDGDLTWRHV